VYRFLVPGLCVCALTSVHFPVFPAAAARIEHVRLRSPRAVSLPFRVFSRSPSHSFQSEYLSGILRPFGACVPKESTYPRGSHPSGYGPCSGFLTLFTASSSFGLVGLFHPTNARRLLPPGFYSAQRARVRFPRARAVLPLSFEEPGARTSPTSDHSETDFTALLPLRGRVPSPGISRVLVTRSPPGLFPLQGLPLRCDAATRHRRSSHALRTVSLKRLRPCASECQSLRRWHCLSRGRRTLLRFVATAS
jgi:hypothetical protein